MIFKDPEYRFQMLRTLGATAIGAADIGECLEAASKVIEGDDETWYSQWLELAKRVEQEAINSQKEGHLESTRSAFRRASNYYRTAEFFLHADRKDPRILETWHKSRSCFRNAVQGLNVSTVQIPFESSYLPGYLSLVDQAPHPLLIAQTGFDGTAEEVHLHLAEAANKRGYHFLVFEGPGQGAVIREQNIPFRPNWETVVTPVIDYALRLPEVKHDQIALLGISFGGLLVPRALAFEHRVQWGIANGGVYDFHAACLKGFPELDQQIDNPEMIEEIDREILEMMKTNPLIRWAFSQGMYTFHAKTPTEWLKKLRPYHLRDLASQIKCQMLIIDSQSDLQMEGQAKQLFDALKCAKDWMLFTNKEGAGAHCQIGAACLSNERIFNWLDDQVKQQTIHQGTSTLSG